MRRRALFRGGPFGPSRGMANRLWRNETAMTNREPTVTQWVCPCCFILHCNGDRCECPSEDHPDGLMGLFEGLELTAGMLREEHADDCFNPYDESEYECDCETDSFSRSSCDGCGSHLGGERHAMTGWIKVGGVWSPIRSASNRNFSKSTDHET